jgi:hypothetical protein
MLSNTVTNGIITISTIGASFPDLIFLIIPDYTRLIIRGMGITEAPVERGDIIMVRGGHAITIIAAAILTAGEPGLLDIAMRILPADVPGSVTRVIPEVLQPKQHEKNGTNTPRKLAVYRGRSGLHLPHT